jgi:hypothetical protein
MYPQARKEAQHMPHAKQKSTATNAAKKKFLVLDTGTLQASQETSKTLTRQPETPPATYSAA